MDEVDRVDEQVELTEFGPVSSPHVVSIPLKTVQKHADKQLSVLSPVWRFLYHNYAVNHPRGDNRC